MPTPETKRNDLAPGMIPEAEAKVREELAAERSARIQTERILGSRAAAPPAPAPRPSEPDYLGKFKEDAALPDGQAESLARGISQRAGSVVRDMVGPEIARVDGKVDQGLAGIRYEMALDGMRSRNPDLDDDKTAAAIGAANREISAKGLKLTPQEHVRLAEKKARELFPRAVEKKETAETPTHVEGASNLNSAAGVGKMAADGEQTGEPEAHPLAEFYFGEGSEVPVVNHDKDLEKNLKSQVDDHVARKNDYLADRGVKTYMPRVAGPNHQRYKARKKAEAQRAAAGR